MTIHKETTGRGLHEPSQYRVENTTGGTITKGTVVKLGGYGTYIKITPVTATSDEAFGVVLDDILDTANGYVGRGGNFSDFDTSAWAVDTEIYQTSSGVLTSIMAGTRVATVLVQSATVGRLLIETNDGAVGATGATGATGPTGPSGGAPDDTVYGVGWNGDTTTAASKNAIYDKIEIVNGLVSSNTTHSGVTTGNPHSVSASDVSLGNVTNESKATMFTSPTITSTVQIDIATAATGYVLTATDIDGNATWQAAGGGAFDITTGVTSNENGTYATDDFVFGGDSIESDANADHASRITFDKSNSAFRAGYDDATYWNIANSGQYSTAFGYRNRAQGTGSSILGGSSNYVSASGTYAAVIYGQSCTASKEDACAGGHLAIASGAHSLALGYRPIASGEGSISLGAGFNVSGAGSVGIGLTSLAAASTYSLTQTKTFSIMGGNVGFGTVTPDVNASLTVAEPIKLASYTVATVPTGVTGGLIYVSDATGSGVTGSLCCYNGTSWIDVTTGIAVV